MRVVGAHPADVGVVEDEARHGGGLGLRQRVLARAVLLRRPVGGEVAVHVAVERHLDRHVDAVEVADPALRVDAIVLAALLARPPLHHDPAGRSCSSSTRPCRRARASRRCSRRRHVLRDQSLDAVEARHEAAVAAPVVVGRQQRQFRPVRVDARQDVEDLLVDEPCHLRVAAVAGEQVPDRVKRGGARGVFLGVDLGVDVVARLLGRRPRLRVGDLDKPDVAPLEALGERAHRGEMRMGRHQGLQSLGHLGMGVVAVEGDVRLAHGVDPCRRKDLRERVLAGG
jgi:hypothetical protein